MAAPHITAIPHELLGEVFVRCSSYSADAPLILSTVCQRFRAVALNTPRAWRSLRLSVCPEKERETIRKAGLWFARSGVCCLDLYVDIAGHKDDIPETHPHLIVFLQRHTTRIASLNVRSETEKAAHSFLDALYFPLPFSPSPTQLPLKTLRLRVASDTPGLPATSAATSVFHSFTHIPHLKSLQLTNHKLPSLFTPDFHNLQTLTIARPLRAPPISVQQLLQIVHAAPYLVNLEIASRVVHAETHHPLFEELYLPYLKNLSLRTNEVPSLIEVLVAPVLEELHINDLDGKRHGASAELTQSLQTVSRKLMSRGALDWRVKRLYITGLSLHRDDPGAQTWEWCLGRARALEELSVASNDEDFEVLVSFLGGEYAGTCVCPLLRMIHVSGLESFDGVERLKRERPGIEIIPDPPEKRGVTSRSSSRDSSRDRRPGGGSGGGAGFGFGFGSPFAAQRNGSRVHATGSDPKLKRQPVLAVDCEDW
ncbi:hypothetical protein F5146DRAFT_1069025 [Armillaria mellea]|nr:hypothetical protein F5146DRAFT_1069025 [Armillaria mellea]